MPGAPHIRAFCEWCGRCERYSDVVRIICSAQSVRGCLPGRIVIVISTPVGGARTHTSQSARLWGTRRLVVRNYYGLATGVARVNTCCHFPLCFCQTSVKSKLL